MVYSEGNYTSFPGFYGFLFRNCNTLPLAESVYGCKKLFQAANELLSRGESILVYPEQAMWYNYRKPRPFKNGAFRMAFRAGVPIVPIFITMRDGETADRDGYPLQLHTLFVMPPIYPDKSLPLKEGAEKMKTENFELCKQKYEEVYGKEYDL